MKDDVDSNQQTKDKRKTLHFQPSGDYIRVPSNGLRVDDIEESINDRDFESAAIKNPAEQSKPELKL